MELSQPKTSHLEAKETTVMTQKMLHCQELTCMI